MPRLRILAGPSLDDLTPIEANSGVPIHIKSDAFDGQIVVHIKALRTLTETLATVLTLNKKNGKALLGVYKPKVHYFFLLS